MQLMWISGPTGVVRKFSVTKRHVLIGACALSLTLVACGSLLYLIGFKIAIEVRPELARSLGGITTKAEQEKMEAVYRGRLIDMQAVLDSTVQEIRQLQTMKDRFMTLATPAPLREKRPTADGGKGGPFLPMISPPTSPRDSLPETFDSTFNEITQFEKRVQGLRQNWSQQLSWLQTLPTGIPINGNFSISSGFGMRDDPFTGVLARHDGLDFTAALGTPILAAADGVVTRISWEDSYGNIIEITHAEGFVTRYAHLNRSFAVLGQKVKRGDYIADVGSTGRSTGPHLHYEVFRNGMVINPAQVLSLNNIQ